MYDLTNYKNDTKILEKIMLAYYYSIPSDNPRSPDEIKLRQDNITYYTVDLMCKNARYGISSISKKEMENYIEKLKNLKAYEIDIIDKIEKEAEKN